VPDVVSALAEVDRHGGIARDGVIEQEELDPGRVFRKEGEVDSFAVPRGA